MRNLREKYEPVANAGGPQPLSPMKATGPMFFPRPRSRLPPSLPRRWSIQLLHKLNLHRTRPGI